MKLSILSDGFEGALLGQSEDKEPFLSLKAELEELISEALRNGYDEFFTDCEYGIPLFAAEYICSLKLYSTIRLTLFIPSEEGGKRLSAESRDRYFAVRRHADRVVFTEKKHSAKSREKAARFMLSESDKALIFKGGNGRCFAETCAEELGVDFQVIKQI